VVDGTHANELAPGIAALAICESLLTSLQDLKIIEEKEIIGLLKDASAAHQQESATGISQLNREAAAVIDRILAGKNSVRHT
jgi:hypothetical protein